MNRMKQLREERGITMKDVACKLGIPYTTYVNYEKGTREPNSEMLIKIADFYNTSIDYLLCKPNAERIDDDVLDKVNAIYDTLLQHHGNIYDAQLALQKSPASSETELKGVYFNFAKEAQENGIDPDDIKLAIETIKKLRGEK